MLFSVIICRIWSFATAINKLLFDKNCHICNSYQKGAIFYQSHKVFYTTERKISGSEQSSDPDPLTRNNQPGFRDLYALFSPIIIRAAPAADHPGHGRKSSSFRYSHPHGLAHILYLISPALSPSAPRSLHKKQGDAAHMLPDGSHASEDFPQQKSPALCVH